MIFLFVTKISRKTKTEKQETRRIPNEPFKQSFPELPALFFTLKSEREQKK